MKIGQLLLMPFSLIYKQATDFRNHLFNIGSKRSLKFEPFIINVGNLSVGGTGKSPMVEYLIRMLSEKYVAATLSRGYGRMTRGFRIASLDDSAQTLGDEPFQFFRKYGEDVLVTVGEERARAIPEILMAHEETNLILLDDAYQHRYVQPDVNILLTEYSKPFFNDYVLPAGRLRESRKGADRADIIIVTKCPELIENKEEYITRIRKYNENANIFFSKIKYGSPKPFQEGNTLSENVFIFTGIAKPEPFHGHIDSFLNVKGKKAFKDHHNYTEADISDLKKIVDEHENLSLITTEKDYVKFLSKELAECSKSLPLFYIPIEAELNDAVGFEKVINDKIENYFNRS
ncbi:tetraacyldisaccharide 4'-kinase [Aureibacter tunicatorum]|uniref:Tetraacyldisaccharide 4'-kinase n=1 Tax=Aureibacter tunicatorum TaxID=866807 RepID=A0AAE3XJT5_9BACT|nr:tetraacyldisaccharide 4'-kinase [Aureibacter tunicatorum]MDR6239076.1 tetraacyldisaccharide 4'-kinase [Aureibacter tunicatorum]BDD04998.1 tetraacyldisaccharide 4'-kinase [Aureibacter tunicatorum]